MAEAEGEAVAGEVEAGEEGTPFPSGGPLEEGRVVTRGVFAMGDGIDTGPQGRVSLGGSWMWTRRFPTTPCSTVGPAT